MIFALELEIPPRETLSRSIKQIIIRCGSSCMDITTLVLVGNALALDTQHHDTLSSVRVSVSRFKHAPKHPSSTNCLQELDSRPREEAYHQHHSSVGRPPHLADAAGKNNSTRSQLFEPAQSAICDCSVAEVSAGSQTKQPTGLRPAFEYHRTNHLAIASAC